MKCQYVVQHARLRSHRCEISQKFPPKNPKPWTLNYIPKWRIIKSSKTTMTINSGVNCMDEYEVMQNTKSVVIGHHVKQLSIF
jgi:hypothetical protein